MVKKIPRQDKISGRKNSPPKAQETVIDRPGDTYPHVQESHKHTKSDAIIHIQNQQRKIGKLKL